jgi:hypothetical protein
LELISGGKIKWVRDFVGPNSGVDVFVRSSNSTVRMNRALRQSLTIDTDGDGIVNGLDIFPLDPDASSITLTDVAVKGSNPSILFSWQAKPGATYTVEYTTDLVSPNWTFLMNYTNQAPTVATATIQDPLSVQTQRYYRVRLNP